MKISRKKIAATICAAFAAIILTTQCIFAYTTSDIDSSYIYNNKAEAVVSPDAYKYIESTVLLDEKGNKASNPQDMFVSEEGEVYVLDTESGKIFIYTSDLTLKNTLDTFVTESGENIKLNLPEGIFVTGDFIYIADTQNNRIILINKSGTVLKIFGKPDKLMGNATDLYLPTKLVVDNTGRMSVIARNINMGIIQLDQEGKFIGYSGTPKVKVDLFTKLWKSFSTKEQKAKMEQFVPTEYNNLAIDSKKFIYGTISSLKASDIKNAVGSKDLSGNTTPVKKINSMGDDILKRKGLYAPLGDLSFDEIPSRIIDIALGPAEVYSLLDSTNGRIFTYDSDGNLLYVFGNKGSNKGNFQRPVAIGYVGQKILVLDSLLSEIAVFDITEYGSLILGAVVSHKEGKYDLSYEKWSQVALINSNFEYAFVGLGKAKLEEGLYKEAMDSFLYASDFENYSKAKEKLRKEQTAVIFPIIFAFFAACVIIAYMNSFLKRCIRYYKGEKIHEKVM